MSCATVYIPFRAKTSQRDRVRVRVALGECVCARVRTPACVCCTRWESKLDKAIFRLFHTGPLPDAQASLCTTSLPSLHFTFQDRSFTRVPKHILKKEFSYRPGFPVCRSGQGTPNTLEIYLLPVKGAGTRQNKHSEPLGVLYRSRGSSGASPPL